MNNTDTKQSYGWTAMILAILLIIFVFLWINARRELANTNENLGGTVAYHSSELVRECAMNTGMTSERRNECEDALEGVAEVMRTYGTAIGARSTTITSTSTIPGGVPGSTTTTPTTTSTTSANSGTGSLQITY